MPAVNTLLDKYREACAIKSDSALADSLHITRQGVHQWRKGLSWPTEDHVIAMAKAIDEPAERWFVAISADRATPAARMVWLRLAQGTAALALGVTLYSFGLLDVQTAGFAFVLPIHYANLCIAAILLTAACAAFKIRGSARHAGILE